MIEPTKVWHKFRNRPIHIETKKASINCCAQWTKNGMHEYDGFLKWLKHMFYPSTQGNHHQAKNRRSLTQHTSIDANVFGMRELAEIVNY